MTDATPSHGLHVREGQAGDIDAVVALDRATALAPHWTRAAYAEMVSPVRAVSRYLVVAETRQGGRAEKEVLAGFAVGLAQGETSELESVVVAAGRRRGGIGLSLATAVIAWVKAQGAMEAMLEVRASNAGAIALYSRLGFLETARRRRHYREPEEDAVVMRLGIGG